MTSDYRERAFEAAIEDCLLNRGGYTKADPESFDRDKAIDPTVLIPFVKSRQPETWQALEKLHHPQHSALHLPPAIPALIRERPPGHRCRHRSRSVFAFQELRVLRP